MLVRAAGNIETSGHADESPEPPTTALAQALTKAEGEIASRAQGRKKETPPDADPVAHHLSIALRLRAPAPFVPSRRASESIAHRDALRVTRAAWLTLATHEQIAVSALDAELEQPAYHERFGTLAGAITEGASNVLRGGRLVSRPQAFRHAAAWRSQAILLTHAIDAYVSGIRGTADKLEQAQLITLTRLVRAVAAAVAIDLSPAIPIATNGRRFE